METIEIAYFAFGGVVEWIHKIQRTITQSNQRLTSTFGEAIQTQIDLTRKCVVRTFVQVVFGLHGIDRETVIDTYI